MNFSWQILNPFTFLSHLTTKHNTDWAEWRISPAMRWGNNGQCMATMYSWSHSPSFTFGGSIKAKVQETGFRSRDKIINPSRKTLRTSAATFSRYWTFVLLKLCTASRRRVRTKSPNENLHVISWNGGSSVMLLQCGNKHFKYLHDNCTNHI
jgi:hypothetical protein